MADIFVATTGNDSTGDGSSGNPYATPGKAASVVLAGDTIYIKFGTYTLTNTTVNTAGGPVKVTFSDEVNITRFVGYNTTATIDNTDSSRPTLSAGTQTTVVLFECSGYGCEFRNLIADGNSKTGTTGFYNSGIYACAILNCKAANCTSYGFRGGPAGLSGLTSCGYCEASGTSGTAGFAHIGCVGCVAHGGTCTGFLLDDASQNNVPFNNCLSYANSGGSSDGFVLSSGGGPGSICSNCTAYNNGRDGFRFEAYGRNSIVSNCLSVGHSSGYGFNISTSTGNKTVNFRNCAGYNNTSGDKNLIISTQSIGFVTLSANPFTNAGAEDFSLNNTSGGGAACRAAGFPGAFPGGLTTGYLDIGAAQSQSVTTSTTTKWFGVRT